MKKSVEMCLDELSERRPELLSIQKEICSAFDILRGCYAAGGKVLACGNGGSASDCEHIVGELMNKLRFSRPIPADHLQRMALPDTAAGDNPGARLQRALPAISLTSQTSLMTAVANDIGADMVFAQQVYGYGCAGDVLIAISTSGSSLNILRALTVARAMGLSTIGLTGRDGGAMASRCDVAIRVPETTTYLVQELHLPVYHTLCSMVEEEFFGA